MTFIQNFLHPYFLLAQLNPGKSTFTRPYDSTQGVPGIVFVIFWIIIIFFLVRLSWEFRDKIFIKKEPEAPKKKGKQP